jgi:hypothetical protein
MVRIQGVAAMRRVLLLVPLVIALTGCASRIAPDGRCAQVIDRPAFEFEGRTLHETPDIKAPPLRRANALLSAGCIEESIQTARTFGSRHASDFHIAFLDARYAWIEGDEAGAESILQRTLADHPDFLSAQVLLASLYAQDPAQLEKARRMLSSLALTAPTDLWVFMANRKLAAVDAPSPALHREFLAIARDPRFPPSARGTAVRLGLDIPNLAREDYLALYRADIEYESSESMACKINHLAFQLVAVDSRYDEARELLESPRAAEAECSAIESNRILLAETYLFQAARLNPLPTTGNASLVSKARNALGGDWSALGRFIMQRPGYEVLAPLVAARIPVAQVDQDGRTQICHAAMIGAVDAVRAQLALGADANGRCEGTSLLGYIVLATSDEPYQVAWQREIVRLLRASGAQVTPEDIEQCVNPDNGSACRDSILPLIQP